MSEAIVVGSGPNGLACAAALAREGIRVTVIEAEETIGGGARTEELTVPGLVHDRCSAIHPMGAASPVLRSLGLQWRHAEIDLAHPLDDGSAGVMVQSIEQTATGLGTDGERWRSIFGGSMEGLIDDVFRPILHVPRHPLALARFGLVGSLPATALARRFRTPQARALFGGAAAHAMTRLTQPLSSAIGAMLIKAGHRYGWPVPRGGSGSIPGALAAIIREHGGTIETGRRVHSLAELPRADAVVLDVAPRAVVAMAGDRLPPRIARAYRRYRHGPAAFKVDFAVDGGVPWKNEACRRAMTVHVGGSFEEIVAAERDVVAGRMPQRPFVLVGQQYLVDPERSVGNVHPVWAYAHVPNGYAGDGSAAIVTQIERFAPGFRERIVATAAQSPAEISAHNANYVGGDIATGACTPVQLLLRPRVTLDPYRTGIPGVFICSAATPPGAGVHGMCGANAAESVLRYLRRR